MKKAAPGYDAPFPKTIEIVPGQSDEALEVFLKARQWLTRDEAGSPKVITLHSPTAARLVYAGILTRTAPRQEDYDNAVEFRHQHDDWRAACTDRQRELLEAAAERAREKRNSEERKAYAERVGRPVRPYQRDRTDEHKKESARESQKRFLHKMSSEDRKKYERDRKAAYREAKRRSGDGLAVETHGAPTASLDARASLEVAEDAQHPSTTVSLERLLEDLIKDPERELTPFELGLLTFLDEPD
ncbi:hypothetical protein [Rhizobium sp. G21]|uniref:hypothetical protein n=1 Tax=Rhizobium sp. G21 TaxID=2758439 RepID=UPI001604388F|nr:hypothetical protein [Rhizobium sp. G21]MBB1250202.1 hypothetical protein [Rhizobium sp. G21]